MFGPNTHFKFNTEVSFSHRDKAFFEVYKSLNENFKDKFNLNNYDILFIPGSGTVGIESTIFSLKSKVRLIGKEGIFKTRWNNLAMLYNDFKKVEDEIDMFCQLETSTSGGFASDKPHDNSKYKLTITNPNLILVKLSKKELLIFIKSNSFQFNSPKSTYY